MSDDLFRTRNTTILADLGPLPEVRESNTETSWRMFVELPDNYHLWITAYNVLPHAVEAKAIESRLTRIKK